MSVLNYRNLIKSSTQPEGRRGLWLAVLWFSPAPILVITLFSAPILKESIPRRSYLGTAIVIIGVGVALVLIPISN